MICLCMTCIIGLAVLFCAFVIWVRLRAPFTVANLRALLPDGRRPVIVGLFHPYCNAGGGGERVLWVAIRALQNRYAHVRCVVYTGDIDVSREEILTKVRQRFNVHLRRTTPLDIHFVYLRRRGWVEASAYPVVTLLGQSLGSVVLGLEALLHCTPDIYLDTMGYAFTLPLFRYLGGCKGVGAYIHYPTISTDMLDRVASRNETYNNRSVVARSRLLSRLKLYYYRVFACMYGMAGGYGCDVVMVNSSWTRQHIESLWRRAAHCTFVVNPPCNVEEFLTIPLRDHSLDETVTIVTVAQFRPEKDHPLQLAAFHKFLNDLPEAAGRNRYRLVLVGSCRNEDDLARVQTLRDMASKMDIDRQVDFELNVSFDVLKTHLADALVGLHTMWNEHFGIGIVECMAAGTIMLAHNSGGPRMDIVVDYNGHKTGFLADDATSYAAALQQIISFTDADKLALRQNARESVKRFSDTQFETRFLDATECLFARY